MSQESVYLMGIGGIGMANVAVLLKEAGYTVVGSDGAIYEPAASILSNANILCKSPYDPNNLPDKSTPIIVGNALSRGHEELESALDRRYELYSFPEFISRKILQNKDSIVVAGTHGKSTTTACLSHLLHSVGLDPGYLIGAQPINFSSGGHFSSGKPFVIEGDEYDSAFFDKRSKFLHYFPQILLLGTVEFDHADIFANLEEMLISFRRLINLLPSNGTVIYNADCKISTELAAAARSNKISVGLKGNPDWKLSDNIKELAFTSPDKKNYAVEYNQIGLHNRMNALMSLAAAVSYQGSIEQYLDGIKTFRGIRRRLEKAFESAQITVFDDFAHHPTAIQAVLNALRMYYPNSNITAVVEPRSNTMVRNLFQEQLPQAFSKANQVIFGSIHRLEKIPENQRLDLKKLSDEIRVQDIACQFIDTNQIPEFLKNIKQSDHNVVVFMSNGSFNGIVQKYVSQQI